MNEEETLLHLPESSLLKQLHSVNLLLLMLLFLYITQGGTICCEAYS